MPRIASNGVTEIIVQEDAMSIERLSVDGGWLYITRVTSYGDALVPAVATTFVPSQHVLE
jgi:hypothetical protein